MIELRKRRPEDRILELGGGDSPHPMTDVRVDVRPTATTHFQHDLAETPWPIKDEDFDGVYAAYVLEHLPYGCVLPFLQESVRVLKPGGSAVFVLPNTEAQQKWITDHPDGWDGKDQFTAASELLYGTQDYAENSHKAFFSPRSVAALMGQAGFASVTVHPYNERGTDMVVTGEKPARLGGAVEAMERVQRLADNIDEAWRKTDAAVAQMPQEHQSQKLEVGAGQREDPEKSLASTPPLQSVPSKPIPVGSPEQLFDKEYFNGGRKVGGYANDQWGAYRDFPVHEVTARHVLDRKPDSVLELGCARGYVLKRVQDAGVSSAGLEVSRHCYLTRVADGVQQQDLCRTPWDWNGVISGTLAPASFDLCFSIATLEHVPEDVLPAVIKEMARTCHRGLHGIDFGEHDDGFDKTHRTLKPRDWWIEQFHRHAPGWPVEVVDKEFLEDVRAFPEGGQAFWDKIRKGDGKTKLGIGCFTTMFHHGWENIDVHDLKPFADQYGYHFNRVDVRNGLPHNTGTVDLVHCCHMLEHLTYKEGLTFLRECRRVLKPGGAMRLIVPDAELLIKYYRNSLGGHTPEIEDFDEINDEAAACPTACGKLWSLLVPGHQAGYDEETLRWQLKEAGFLSQKSVFRGGTFYPEVFSPEQVQGLRQILRETLDMLPCLSLYVDAVPLTA